MELSEKVIEGMVNLDISKYKNEIVSPLVTQIYRTNYFSKKTKYILFVIWSIWKICRNLYWKKVFATTCCIIPWGHTIVLLDKIADMDVTFKGWFIPIQFHIFLKCTFWITSSTIFIACPIRTCYNIKNGR